MTKSRKVYHKEYKVDHKLAKAIVCFLVMCLLVISFWFETDYRWVANWFQLAAVAIWFFGVNPVQRMIETLCGHSHKVDKI